MFKNTSYMVRSFKDNNNSKTIRNTTRSSDHRIMKMEILSTGYVHMFLYNAASCYGVGFFLSVFRSNSFFSTHKCCFSLHYPVSTRFSTLDVCKIPTLESCCHFLGRDDTLFCTLCNKWNLWTNYTLKYAARIPVHIKEDPVTLSFFQLGK